MISKDPYRSTEDGGTEPDDGRFEERALAVVLLIAGVIGVVVGSVSPRARSLELAVGAVIFVLGLRTWHLAALRRKGADRPKNSSTIRRD